MCKRVICLAFVCALGLAPVASAELVGWWKLDDGEGTVVKDSSGNGIDGDFVGTPKWAEGMNGTGALEFDGNSWLDFGAPPKTLFTGTMPLSIALWINPTSLGTTLGASGHDRAFVARNQNYAFKSSGPYARFTTPGRLDYNAQKTVLKVGEWQHVAVTFEVSDRSVAVFYLDGVETDRVSSTTAGNTGYNTAAATAGATAAGGPFLIGNNQWATNQMYFGRYDDIRLYDHILTAAEVKQVAFRAKAYKPSPANGAIGVSQALFQWQPGSSAMLHNVYFGTSAELTQADLVGPGLPFTMYFHVAGLQPGTTYYWRVDEVEADGKTVHTGDVWSFTATPAAAWAQKPAEGSTHMPSTMTLQWSAGMNAATHDVYLSTDRAAVEAGAAAAKVADKQGTTTFDAASLERGKTYYWRVDEMLITGSPVTGDIWSFSVRPVFAQTDPNLLAWWKLDDENSPYVVDYSGSDYYGTLVGNPQWVEGFLGDALQFNGSTDYVNCGTPAALFLPTNYTYSLWFKVAQNINGNSGTQFLLCIGQRSDLVFGVADGVGVNGDLALHYYEAAPGAKFNALRVGQTVWSADEWHMVTATRDATGHRIYLDGELRNSDTNAKNDNHANTRMISLGSRAWTAPTSFFRGALDDVRIYNRALTADEIRQVMRGDIRLAWNPQPKVGATLDIRDATALTWSAGDGAAKHDVYLGKDKAAVQAADPTSPLYQGRQSGTSLSLNGLVEMGGGAYFWRVDEVEADGTTIHKGAVWSFTVPAYLVVDEFEAYTDDEGSRIYETWIDGWTNGTGSTVGNLVAPFAERTIVHSGRQAMPMDYNNTKSPFYSEAEQVFAPLQDWTVGAVTDLSLWFRGRPAQPALVEAPAGQYKIGAASNDIWGTADSFRFFYKTLNGDGTITAKVIALTGTTTNWAKAGVMIRESLDPASTYAITFPTPDRRRAFQNRPVAGGTAFSAHSAAGAFTALPFWVRVERKGSQITGYYSTDGTTWTRQPDTENTGADRSLNPVSISMADRVLIGLAVASNNFGAAACFGEFSDVTTTGAVSGQWQLVNVGINYGNDPDTFCLAVEDSAGKSALVTHPDPAAVGLTAWTEWKVPLSSLTGVNLARVKKLSIGVGDKKVPVPGGTGRLYIDDIRVTKP